MDNTNCPQCNCAMVLRTNRANGTQFYGCASFPSCRGTRPADSVVAVTREFLRQVANCGALKRAQVELLGEPWPLTTGWKDRVIGRHISHDAAKRLMTLKGTSKGQSKGMVNGGSPSTIFKGETADLQAWRAQMIAADTSTVAPF